MKGVGSGAGMSQLGRLGRVASAKEGYENKYEGARDAILAATTVGGSRVRQV